jgi:methionine synthase II (cobalamin-independent)
MQLQQNTDRIQTTHIGSLPRPHRLLDVMKAKYAGQSHDEKRYQETLRNSVADAVRERVQCGNNTKVHRTVVWEKFKAMRAGADLATEQLWG